jgi:hypothetical protein
MYRVPTLYHSNPNIPLCHSIMVELPFNVFKTG